MTVQTPDAADIRHFVEKVREIDKRNAVQNYIRSGQTNQGSPDEKVVRVLSWLDALSSVGECADKEKAK